MQHLWFYSILVCVFLLAVLIGLINERDKSPYWNKYHNCKCLVAIVMGLLLWPFIDHPFVFSVTFMGVFHDGWDMDIARWFKDNFEFVEFDEWIGRR